MKSICILSLSPIARDARLLRQIEYLSPYYELTVIGYGEIPTAWKDHPHIHWKLRPKTRFKAAALPAFLTRFLASQPAGIPAALRRSLYERLYWSLPNHPDALQAALATRADAFHANDWNTLPAAAAAARQQGARLVFDAHEYAPLEWENRPLWMAFVRPVIVHLLRTYAPQVDASITVCSPLGERYQQEFGLQPLIVLNAPKPAETPAHAVDPANIRLLHHGGAIRDRRLESMIETLQYCDRRFTLHFMLVESSPGYIQELKELGEKLAPGRVFFHDPLPPEQVVEAVAAFDMGIFLLEPYSFSVHMSLPNKFFDFIAAGLAVCIGPSPAMAGLVDQYGFGCVAPSFDPRQVAETLNRLDAGQIEGMRRAARQAARLINADLEMQKLIDLYRTLI